MYKELTKSLHSLYLTPAMHKETNNAEMVSLSLVMITLYHVYQPMYLLCRRSRKECGGHANVTEYRVHVQSKRAGANFSRFI